MFSSFILYFPLFFLAPFFFILIFSKFKVNKQNQRTTFSSSSSSSFSLCWFCGLPVSKQTHHHLNGWPLGDVVSTSTYHLRPQILFLGISFLTQPKEKLFFFLRSIHFKFAQGLLGAALLWCWNCSHFEWMYPRYMIVGGGHEMMQ